MSPEIRPLTHTAAIFRTTLIPKPLRSLFLLFSFLRPEMTWWPSVWALYLSPTKGSVVTPERLPVWLRRTEEVSTCTCFSDDIWPVLSFGAQRGLSQDFDKKCRNVARFEEELARGRFQLALFLTSGSNFRSDCHLRHCATCRLEFYQDIANRIASGQIYLNPNIFIFISYNQYFHFDIFLA